MSAAEGRHADRQAVRRHRIPALGVLLVGILLGAGCHPDNPLDERVSARTAPDYANWRSRIADRLDAAQARELDAMVEEIRLGIMVDGRATGSEAVNELLWREIDGRALREVLANGYQKKRQHLDLEKTRMDELIERDAHLRFKPGDEESRAFVAEQVGKMKVRSAEIAYELETVNRRLDELGVPTSTGPRQREPERQGPKEPKPEPPDEAPQRLPPEQ